MKAMPTLQGGLRIDAEDAEDWELLRSIVEDAGESDLAGKLGALIDHDAGAEDWEDLVVPDLRESFQDNLAEVGASIEAAIVEAGGEAGPVWITPESAFAWYSALNQARLALEDLYRFGPSEWIDPKGLTRDRGEAFIRSKFYCAIQGLLLEYVMK